MSRLLSRSRSAWTRRTSPENSCKICRAFSQSSRCATAASPYRDGELAKKGTRRPGLPEDMAQRADLDNKTIQTPVGELPMSPLMDPTFHERRMKYKMPKAPESSVYKKVKWRRTLDRNPWAHALATDIRRCPASSTIIPRYFLQDFNLVAHPETGDPWYVPTSLAPRRPASPEQQQPDAVQSDPAGPQPSTEPSTTLADSAQAGAQPLGRTHRRKDTNNKPAGPTSYMLARQDLIALQGTKSRGDAASWKRLMALNHSFPKFSSVLKHVVWREDMGSLVLELMRRRAVEELVYYARLGEDANRNAYVVRCDTWDGIMDPAYNGHRGCVLWFGGRGGKEEEEDREEEDGPGPRAVMDVPGVRFGRKIPVHNMQALLGREHVARLRDEAGLFRDGCLFMLVRARTMELQLKLWKLQGYLAHPLKPSGAPQAKNSQRMVEEDAEE